MKPLTLIFLGLALFASAAGAAPPPLPSSAGICVQKADTLFKSGKPRQAANTLEAFKAKAKGKSSDQIRQKGYDHFYIHFLLGTYYLALAEKTAGANGTPLLKKAAGSFEAAAKRDETCSAAWLNLAKCRYEIQDFARAAHGFQKGYQTAKTPRASHLYYAAVCLFQAGKPSQSATVFQKLLNRHPKDVTLSWKETFVQILFSLERFKPALPLLEELARQPDRSKRRKWQEILLQQYLALNMNPKALNLAQRLTRAEPLEPRWWKALCHIHLDQRQIRSGLAALLIYGYLTPLTKQEQTLAADLYLSLGVPKQAARLYETAASGSPSKRRMHNACQAYLMAHDTQKALDCIDQCRAGSGDKTLLRLKAHAQYIRRIHEKTKDAWATARP